MSGRLHILGRALCPLFVLTAVCVASRAQNGDGRDPHRNGIACANLIYAGGKTSSCFSDRFLQRLQDETHIRTSPHFQPVVMSDQRLFDFPFAVMSGDGAFRLSDLERARLKYYISHGGFVLASASCSDGQWARSFHAEFNHMFPAGRLTRLALDHPLLRMVYRVDNLATVHGGADVPGAGLSAYVREGRIAVVFSGDGLNDTSHARNCCCCGGDEVNRAEFVNVDVLAYALLH